MKRKENDLTVRKILVVPTRHMIAMLLIFLEYSAIIAGLIALIVYFPVFYIAVIVIQIIVAIGIINSNDNPDYKVPWLFFVMLIPIIGFMTYFMFYSRNISKKQLKKNSRLKNCLVKDDSYTLEELEVTNPLAYSQAKCLKNLAETHIYQNTDITYMPSGEEMFSSLLQDLKRANEFIFLDYFIIEQGLFWNTILNVLKDKVSEGVEVRVVYDDIGCMTKLPGKYYKTLRKIGIYAIPFGILKGQANNEFNNRNHRKITIIDGKIAYTGGLNLADEYINHTKPYGHWKDVAIRLEGEAVDELTRLFLYDYGISDKKSNLELDRYIKGYKKECSGLCIPFGDGPKPIYNRRVAKTLIITMLGQAERYMYITTPYLIIDGELTSAIENASLRGVDVRIITPHIPDKKAVFMVTRGSYDRLMKAGVKIYEYEPGFIHAKTYICDDKFAIVGTINLDYRSLVHHYENGVWICNHPVIKDIKKDFENSQSKSIKIEKGMFKERPLTKTFKSLISIFSSLL